MNNAYNRSINNKLHVLQVTCTHIVLVLIFQKCQSYMLIETMLHVDYLLCYFDTEHENLYTCIQPNAKPKQNTKLGYWKKP